jgi:phenylalanyl-tRNA synthetase beta chain
VVPDSEIESILGSLGCDVSESDGDFTVIVPTYRRDLEREIDLVEEVARIHGLDKLPSTVPGRVEGRGGLSAAQRRLRGMADTLRGAGLNEVITWSFVDPSWHDRLRLATDDLRRRTVAISNPLSQDQSVMRTMLLPGLLAIAQRNAAVREQRIHLFEIGTTFHPEIDAPTSTLPHEVRRVGILMSGAWEEDSWNAARLPTDFFLGKGVVERLLYALGVEGVFGRAAEPFLHPGKSAALSVGDQYLGWLGEVHPLVLQAFDLPAGAVAAELDAGALLSLGAGVALFEDLLTYPAVEHDLALVVDRDVAADEVVRAVRAAGGGLLRSVSVFDVFEGAQVGEGKKSLALRLSFRSPERTLAEAEVNDARAGMLEALRTGMGAELRA